MHGTSRWIDHERFDWSDSGWQPPPLTAAVIYELHLGTFTPEGTCEAAVHRLDHLVALGWRDRLHYWRNKDKRELDLVLQDGELLHTISCPLSAESFVSRSLETFRKFYPLGANLVVLPNLTRAYTRFYGNESVDFIAAPQLAEVL